MIFRIQKFLRAFLSAALPPPAWRIPVILLLGVFSGIGILVLYAANAFSYVSDNPRVCINCHIMVPQYDSWLHSAHAKAATCNDCHVPQDNFFRQYAFKARDGMRHAAIFTLRREPQAIIMHQAGRDVVQQNCVRCHNTLLSQIPAHSQEQLQQRRCWECHRSTPHGRVRSLSSAPYSRAPLLEGLLPERLRKFFKNNQSQLSISERPQ